MALPEQSANDLEHESSDAARSPDFVRIDQLTALGINQGDVKKLMDGGYHTVAGLTMDTVKNLSDVKGLSEAKVIKILEAARQLDTLSGIITAKDFERHREQTIAHISSGSTAIDTLLGGGFETQALCEIYGEAKSGKSQLCHTIAVTAQLHETHGGKVMYLDTENTFRPQRIRQIAARFGVDPEQTLENINFARVPNSEALVNILPMVVALMAEQQYRLLIVDSVMAHFRVDFSVRSTDLSVGRRAQPAPTVPLFPTYVSLAWLI